MKKISALILSAVLMLTAFAGCAQNSKAALAKALEKTNGLSSFESKVDSTIKLGMNGAENEVPSSAKIKCVKEGEGLKMEVVTSSEVEGQKMDTTVYYSGGYMYMSPMGQKVKMAMPLEDAEKMAASMGSLTEDMMEEVTTEKVEGGTKYTVAIDGKKLGDFAAQAMAGVQSSLQDLPGADILENTTYENVQTYVVVGDDGYAHEQWMAMDMTVKVGEGDAQQELKFSIDTTNVFINPGQQVTVELPADLAEYQDISEAAE